MAYKNPEDQKLYMAKWHQERKAERYAKKEERLQKNRAWLMEYRKTLTCEICGESHPACLDFHHRDASEKIKEVSWMIVRGWSMEKIQAEIEKCQVLCSNCHRKLHYQEKLGA